MTSDRASASLQESAACHLVRNVPTTVPEATCGDTLALLRKERFEYAEAVVVLDGDRRVLGLLPAGELASHAADISLERVMRRGLEVAHADMDQERVASLAIANGIATVPVVEMSGAFLGLITPQTLLEVSRREHIEDLHRLTGTLRETEVARAAIEDPPARRARHRLPWLLVGLVGSGLAALVMAHFESLLRAHIAVAFFLPGIVYLADAVGTQTEAIAVRALSFGNARIGRLLGGELRTGLMIGGTLGTVAVLVLWGVVQDLRLALAVGVGLVAASGLATGIGFVLPWLFHRVGFDPAYGSGPLATVVQDVLTLVIYFLCVIAFLEIPIDLASSVTTPA